jgi:hypothetical protein
MSSSLRALPYTAALLVLATPPLAARVPGPVREEAASVCVIDPAAPTGCRQMSTIDLPATGDAVVVVHRQRIPLRDVVGAAQTGYALLTAGQPPRIPARGDEVQLPTCDAGQVPEPDRLACLGTVDRIPVYAGQNAVQDITGELQEARSAGQTHDLEASREARDDLRGTFKEIEVLYPLPPAACCFQPVMSVEMVRAGRGQERMCCAG